MAVYHRHMGAFPLNFIVVGAGGTGSRIVQQLTQLVSSMPFMKNLAPQIFIIDDDTVEEKNLARQLFARADVGKNKAQVVANRYGAAYGLTVHAIGERVVGKDCLATFTMGTLIENGMTPEDSARTMARRTVVIMAVDSMEARRSIIASALHLPSPLNMSFIDPGNEDTFGQVTTFSAVAQSYVPECLLKTKINALPDLCPVALNIGYLPMPLVHYFFAQDGEATGGCADLDQTLALNSMAASRTIDYLQAMMFNVPIAAHTTRFFLGGEASCQKMDVSWVKRVMNNQEYNVSDYERIADLFDVTRDEFYRLISDDSSAGDQLFKKLKKGVVLPDSCRLILNALYFVPVFDPLEAEKQIKEYDDERIRVAREMIGNAGTAPAETVPA